MPIIVQRYLCNYCKNEYHDYQTAMNCEELGIPPNPYPEGSIIQYEDESTMFGSRWSYSTESGIVLYSWMGVVESKSNPGAHAFISHGWSWIVKPNNEFGEVLVKEVLTEFGMRLISQAEDKYKPGYADTVRSRNNSI